MTDRNQTIRIGIIGAGANTRLMHLPGFQAIEGVSVDVVCNRSEATSRKAAEAFGIPRIAKDWKAVVGDPSIDAVMVGTWPYLHAEATVAALESGKHVLTEARMARDLAEAEAMLEASVRHPELVTQIVPAPMSLDFDAVVQDLLTRKTLGDIREVCVTHTGAQFVRSDTPATWRQSIELSGCNMLTMGIYYEIVRRWLGTDPESVIASGAVFTPTRPGFLDGSPESIGIPDSVTILGHYAEGARFIGHFSGVESGRPRNEIRLNGSKGSLRVDFAAKELFRAEAGVAEERPVDVPVASRRGWRVEADFVDSIRTGAPVRLTSFADGVRYMAFTEAVFKSVEAGGVAQSVSPPSGPG
ncbi:MAG: Gfo/Idh/MocA family oxidoreductase [Opitutaceae bacterium]